jgi:hypothetical protein
MAEQNDNTPEPGTACAITLRRVLPLALDARRDPWDVARQLGALHGCEAAPLIAGNALRWRIAHDFARMGRRDLARAMIRRELTIEGGEA